MIIRFENRWKWCWQYKKLFTPFLIQICDNLNGRTWELNFIFFNFGMSLYFKKKSFYKDKEEGTVIQLSTDKFCPDCEGTGYIEHDAGGGNSYKLACERCEGKGTIKVEEEE